MRKLILMVLVIGPMMTSSIVWSAEKALKPTTKPPVNNAVPPCDNSPNSKKPSCDMDSDSVNVPPKMPHERGVIVPSEVPAEGLPNREKDIPQPKEPMQPTSFENNLQN